ncbi:response regulator [Pueribacillus theae]|uniref:Response regulator n=1 Tax=Pueribacillus theae TaxID=2171751 RepID=A0A2U1K7U3_9BACI|nr:response regulator [Pueribacillus theae]PWA13063.1 response regulator [Pueribacillus theae]
MAKKILIVEDESIVRLDVSLMLKEAGYEVIGEANNGEKAIEMLHSLKPDLIIMDIKMPKLNGLKASEIISSKYNIPIVLLTAYSQREFVDKAKNANIFGYLVKPINESNLIPAVEIALKQAENANTYKEKLVELDSKLKSRKVVEKAKGILMDRFQLTEEDAHRKMRKISMDKQVPLDKIAKSILTKYSS